MGNEGVELFPPFLAPGTHTHTHVYQQQPRKKKQKWKTFSGKASAGNKKK